MKDRLIPKVLCLEAPAFFARAMFLTFLRATSSRAAASRCPGRLNLRVRRESSGGSLGRESQDHRVRQRRDRKACGNRQSLAGHKAKSQNKRTRADLSLQRRQGRVAVL